MVSKKPILMTMDKNEVTGVSMMNQKCKHLKMHQSSISKSTAVNSALSFDVVQENRSSAARICP